MQAFYSVQALAESCSWSSYLDPENADLIMLTLSTD